MDNFDTQLDVFLTLLETSLNAKAKRDFSILQENALKEGRRGYHECGADMSGGRFVRVWDSTDPYSKSVKYFVEKETGVIFGAKSWKAYNPVHEYGTLDTVNEWNWEGYYAVHKEGKTSIVPKALRK